MANKSTSVTDSNGTTTVTPLTAAADELVLAQQKNGPSGPDGCVAISGGSGTVAFATAVVSIQGRLNANGKWRKLAVIDRSDNTTKSGNISLTDDTPFDFFLPNSLLYDDVKIVLESIGSGKVVVEMESCPAVFAPALIMGPTLAVATTAQLIDAASASAFVVGPDGATNPTLKVDTATASAATGLSLTSAAAAAGFAVAVISSGTNENLTIDAKGSGTITLGGTSTGATVIGSGGITGAVAATALAIVGKAGSSAAGEAITITGGAGNGAFAGGAITITGGAGGAAGAGGAVSVVGGVPASSNAAGGAGTFSGGAGAGTGAGGAVTTRGGASGAGATGNGGAWSGGGGAATSTNGTGGAATLSGGVGTGTGVGGAVTIITGASGGASGTAGALSIDTGSAAGGTGAGITIGGTNATFTKIGTGSEQAAIKAINVSGTISVAVPSITDPDIASVDVDLSGMTFAPAVGDMVVAIPLEALPSNCRLQGAWVSATDTVQVTYGSLGGNVTGASKNHKFLLIDLT